jgi:predicted phosphate transport protein (TIGR00153 family)
MFHRLLPREENFFTLFNSLAQEAVSGANELHSFFADLSQAPTRIAVIADTERRADRIAHDITDLLHHTFITPFDRDQISLLASRMDDVMDLIEDVAQTIVLYDVRTLTPEARQLEQINLLATEKMARMIALLSDMKNAKAILNIANEIKGHEHDADNVMRAGIASLFREEKDAHELVKMKEVYELLETVTDRCDDVADIAKGVVLENA